VCRKCAGCRLNRQRFINSCSRTTRRKPIQLGRLLRVLIGERHLWGNESNENHEEANTAWKAAPGAFR